jgi:hypothetical protein
VPYGIPLLLILYHVGGSIKGEMGRNKEEEEEKKGYTKNWIEGCIRHISK